MLNLLLMLLVVFSFIVTYYSKIVKKDYQVFYTESGLPELDE